MMSDEAVTKTTEDCDNKTEVSGLSLGKKATPLVVSLLHNLYALPSLKNEFCIKKQSLITFFENSTHFILHMFSTNLNQREVAHWATSQMYVRVRSQNECSHYWCFKKINYATPPHTHTQNKCHEENTLDPCYISSAIQEAENTVINLTWELVKMQTLRLQRITMCFWTTKVPTSVWVSEGLPRPPSAPSSANPCVTVCCCPNTGSSS